MSYSCVSESDEWCNTLGYEMKNIHMVCNTEEMHIALHAHVPVMIEL